MMLVLALLVRSGRALRADSPAERSKLQQACGHRAVMAETTGPKLTVLGGGDPAKPIRVPRSDLIGRVGPELRKHANGVGAQSRTRPIVRHGDTREPASCRPGDLVVPDVVHRADR